MILSVVIPAYNAEPYLGELVQCLEVQIQEDVEVIIVDDGSDEKVSYKHPWLKVIRQKNKGVSFARNKGLDAAAGDYIQFIDADDLVAPDYIKAVLGRIQKGYFDVCDLSWRSLDLHGAQFNRKLGSENDWLDNPSACTRVFSRRFIGDTRFSELKDATEDEDFSRRLGYLDHDKNMVHTAITEYMYFYRTAVTDSKSKRFKKGLMNTKRVVYYYRRVTKDMTWLIEQIREDDERNEVWLLTEHNELPELKRWCRIQKPIRLWTHYLKGEHYTNIDIIQTPHKTDVVLYINSIQAIGGIGTFAYNFCEKMRKYYDITYVVNNAPDSHIMRMSQVATVIRNQPKRQIICDTLIMLRILDRQPANIIHNKSIQMCHACRTNPGWHIPQDSDYIVNVSETSKKSFGEDAKDAHVIHNLIKERHKKTLLLISATRIPAPDKGDNEKRMFRLAKMLNDAGIPFQWLNFSEGTIPNAPRGFHNLGPEFDIDDFFPKADYVVQLSTSEAWSYTVLEALTQNVPVICTEFPSAYEMGIEDGKNGYILPYDMDFDVRKLLDVPKFTYTYDNDRIVRQWKELIARKLPAKKKQNNAFAKVRVVTKYRDIRLNELLNEGEERIMYKSRAEELKEKGLVMIID